MKHFWLGQQSQRHFQRHPEQAFAADKQSGVVGPDRFDTAAAHRHDFAGRQHRFASDHVIRRHAVLQTVRAARVERDVAADRADALAGRIGSVVQTMRSRGIADVLVDHARLDHGDPLLRDQARESCSADSVRSRSHRQPAAIRRTDSCRCREQRRGRRCRGTSGPPRSLRRWFPESQPPAVWHETRSARPIRTPPGKPRREQSGVRERSMRVRLVSRH